MSDQTHALIEIRDVVKQFPHTDAPVLNGVDLTVERGEMIAISGASGSGKSTLLHLIAALDRPTRGTITVNGRDIEHRHDLNHYRREEIGIIFQLHNLLPRLSAIENVELAMFGTSRSRRERVDRARQLLDQVGLSAVARREPARLSGGERQRVAIARALANDPAVILADEPTGSLDAEAAELIVGLLERLNRDNGATILMVTHDALVAARATRHVRLTEAKLTSDGDQRPYGGSRESRNLEP